MKHLRHLLLLLSIVTLAAHSLYAQQAGQLTDGDLVAICGDSITEQEDYSVNIQQAIRDQQNFETPLVKSLLHNLPQYLQFVPEEAETLQRVAERLIGKDKKLRDASSAAVKPVTHSIQLQVID